MKQQQQFGYYPDPLDLHAGQVTITSTADLASIRHAIEGNDGVEGPWIYAPPQHDHRLEGGTVQRPYPSRIFGLPKTHVLAHASSDGDDHMAFHLWSLSFFTGMRLTSTEAGFVDATPIQPGRLVDFILIGHGLCAAIELTEGFWIRNRSAPERARLFGAAVHALFLGQAPRSFQFERLLLLYTAMDACFALCKSMKPPGKHVVHGHRVEWMCNTFNMPVPSWAAPSPTGQSEVASLRNDAVHEALFMDAPLGFALHGALTNKNLTLEMQALICRLLVALIGEPNNAYVGSPVDTRQRHGLELRTPLSSKLTE